MTGVFFHRLQQSLATLHHTNYSLLRQRQHINYRLIPARTVTRRRRPSDAWFDEECRAMKRRVRRLESAVRRAEPTDAVAVAAVNAAWTTERRIYRALL